MKGDPLFWLRRALALCKKAKNGTITARWDLQHCGPHNGNTLHIGSERGHGSLNQLRASTSLLSVLEAVTTWYLPEYKQGHWHTTPQGNQSLHGGEGKLRGWLTHCPLDPMSSLPSRVVNSSYNRVQRHHNIIDLALKTMCSYKRPEPKQKLEPLGKLGGTSERDHSSVNFASETSFKQLGRRTETRGKWHLTNHCFFLKARKAPGIHSSS